MFKKIIYAVILYSLSAYCFSQEIEGSWTGSLNVMGNNLRIAFNIEKNGAEYTSKMDSPDQGAFALPTTKTTFSDSLLEITATQLGIIYQGKLDGDSISGKFTQSSVSFPLVLKKTEKLAEPKRPQTPEPPYSYTVEEVIIENKTDSVSLSGTLTLPDCTEKVPVVVLIAGSGPNDRDENILGHKPFLVIADHLTKNGIAVLRYDKRGVGKSSGDYARATTLNFANDVKSVMAYLEKRPEINKNKIGLIGHSEGGIIAPIVAAGNKKVAFIVSMAGTGVKGIDVIMYQNEIAMKQQNMEPKNIEELQKINREIFESLKEWKNTDQNRTDLRDKLHFMWNKTPLLIRMKMNKDQFIRNNFNTLSSPWFRTFLHLYPAEYLRKVACPVLILNGEKDMQVVAPKNPESIKQALEKGGNFRSEVKIYPSLNHLFQECETGYFDEYGKIEQTISPEVLSHITNWIKKQQSKSF